MDWKLTKDEKDKIIEKIINYFHTERDEEIGELAASLLLDFIIEDLGPHFYNLGISDSIKYIQERVEDMYGMEKK